MNTGSVMVEVTGVGLGSRLEVEEAIVLVETWGFSPGGGS